MTTRAGVGIAYGALWVATATGALAGRRLIDAGPPRDGLQASASTAAELLTHNGLVALWPLALVAAGWSALPIARVAGDALVTGQLLVHGLLVGDAIAQQPSLWRYLPHLPLEWLGIAAPVAGWMLARRDELTRNSGLRLAAFSLAALIAAAALETWAVPL